MTHSFGLGNRQLGNRHINSIADKIWSFDIKFQHSDVITLNMECSGNTNTKCGSTKGFQTCALIEPTSGECLVHPLNE